MGFDAFIQTKGFGFICMLFCFFLMLWQAYRLGYAIGERDAEKREPKTIHTDRTIVPYEDGRILTFDSRVKKPFIIDMKNNRTIHIEIEPNEVKDDNNDIHRQN